jgi:hypothetical protein
MLPALLALALLQSGDGAGPVYDGRARQLDVRPPRADATITVDGSLEEPVWHSAARLTGFSQYRPVDGRPAADSTVVLVWYGPDAIYFGIRGYEAHGGVVRATLADRDNIGNDDNIQILLDTYNDHRRALLFAVNPLGVQQDGVRSEGQDAGAAGGGGGTTGRFDGTIDLSPDFVYQSRGHVTPWGFEVEVRIPFKSIRYQSADPQDWGIQVVRTTQHTGYEDTWTPVVRASASFLIQSGRLQGLTDLHRGLVMDLNPEFTTHVDGAPAGGGSRYVYTGDPQLGGNLRWGISQNLNATATVNPDFSQVEADAAQVTVNQRFALFFPEKRPFFLEGLEQFDTPNRLIYTRQIGNPVAGAKLTGKMGETNVAYLAAVDDRSFSPTGDNPVFNLLRLQRDLGASSSLGVAYTDRAEGSAYNRVLGADARVVWKRVWFSQVQVVESWDRAAGAGTLWAVTLGDRTGRSYGNHFEFQGISPDFVARAGFVNRTGIVFARLFNRFTWYGRPGALLETIETRVGMSPLWRYDDFARLRGTIEGGYTSTWLANIRGGWGLNATVSNNMQRFDGAAYAGYQVDRTADTIPFALPHGLYNLWSGNAGFTTPNGALSYGLSAGYGASPIFAEAGEGRQWSVAANANWRPTPSIRMSASWVYQRLSRARDGSRFSTANIPRLKLEYQLTRAIFFRYIGQYFAQDQVALEDPRTGQPLLVNGAPAGPVTVNDFRNDVLFSYKPNPGTVLFFGYGASLDEPQAFAFRDLHRTGDGFFLKASYLFRM